LPADDWPQGQTALLPFFLASVDFNLSDIGERVCASGLRGLSGITTGDEAPEPCGLPGGPGLPGLPVFELATLSPRAKGLTWRGLCRRVRVKPLGEPGRGLERPSEFGVVLLVEFFFWSITMICDDLRVCAWCLPERRHF
jgi:hypothetical protein